MLKQKLKINSIFSSRVGMAALALLVVTSLTGGLVAHADQFDNQIQQLQAQNDLNQNVLNNLQITANNYQDAINKLQARISQLQSVISKTEAEQASVKAQIADAQKQLDQQKVILGDAIKTMYIDGQTTTLEVLLSSNNLSDFVDQEQYHITVQNNIKMLVDKISALKAQLQKQNDKLTLLLQNQKAQQQQVSEAQRQQSLLLGYNQSQQAHFNGLIANNNSEIASLRAQQAAAYASYVQRSGISSYSVGEAGNGGYPPELANAYQDTVVDNWGMWNRECVSYVAWKVSAVHGDMPYWGSGNANAYNWVNLAQQAGIATGSSPRTGSVVVWGHNDGMGWLGHVAYVEMVNSDRSIEVSQYNVVHGQFSRMHVDAATAASLHYIYF